jgi:2-iminobutanoate/2-iminopropanoate deaminase
MSDLQKTNRPQTSHLTKLVPEGAGQHATAGPYSPVLEVDSCKLVVISGQVGVDMQGNVVGETIEEQTRCTLDNCRRQLETAGCTFADVFKANVYLTDLKEWPRFNAVYAELIPEPRPVRTAIGAALLPGFLVEIEMWAAKRV